MKQSFTASTIVIHQNKEYYKLKSRPAMQDEENKEDIRLSISNGFNFAG